MSTARALIFGALVVGILDGLDAVVFFGLRGVPAATVFQSIAGGLLGRASYQGGVATALLGVALHFFIAFCVCLTYLLASRRFTPLRRTPVLWGILYGIAVYVVMNQIVVPLSALPRGGPPAWPVVVNGVLIHMFGVGLPAALFAAAARPPERVRTS